MGSKLANGDVLHTHRALSSNRSFGCGAVVSITVVTLRHDPPFFFFGSSCTSSGGGDKEDSGDDDDDDDEWWTFIIGGYARPPSLWTASNGGTLGAVQINQMKQAPTSTAYCLTMSRVVA